jgi:hypothetical protein
LWIAFSRYITETFLDQFLKQLKLKLNGKGCLYAVKLHIKFMPKYGHNVILLLLRKLFPGGNNLLEYIMCTKIEWVYLDIWLLADPENWLHIMIANPIDQLIFKQSYVRRLNIIVSPKCIKPPLKRICFIDGFKILNGIYLSGVDMADFNRS